MSMSSIAGALSVLLSATIPQDPAPDRGEPHIEWQRSLADALAVQKATGLPLLLVVNMDGEVFNDRFATTTYRDPAFVELTRGYVCVVASPDRHTERDYDALGNRVECPRFPGCTCSEHVNVEPELFRRWFDNKRNAPRHVGVSPDGKVLFDRYLDQSMQTAVDAIAKHRGQPKPEHEIATLTPEALLTRRDALARRTLEARYRAGDAARRAALLEAAAKASNEPFDLLRMGQREDDEQLFAAAARALAKVATKDALIDVEDALARTADAELTRALTARLREIGKDDPNAARLASCFATDPAAKLDGAWAENWSPAVFDAADRGTIEASLDRAEAALRTAAKDDAARLALATAQAAAGALLAAEGGKNAGLWFEDAARNAGMVAAAPFQAEAKAVLAIAAWNNGDAENARAAVAQALAAKTERKPDAWLARTFLEVAVQTAAADAYEKARKDATASLRTEVQRVQSMLRVLAERDACTEGTFLAGAGLLEYAGLRQRAARILEDLVARFPASAAVHERWRTRLFVDLGAELMRRRYAAWVDRAADKPTAEWFAGYASLVAGEQHTRDERRELAAAAYTDAIARFARSAAGNEGFTDSANHYAVLALAGRAVLRQRAGDGDGAVADLLQAAGLRPDSLDQSDGLQRKPRAIADRIARELSAQGKTELAERLKPILP